jgi:ATP-dependent RNA helicase DeaD
MDQHETESTVTFAGLGLNQALLDALVQLGYEEPTPIQREAIPPLLAGRDLLGQAATGTGKTAAFALPLLQRLTDQGRGREPVALVLVPTRELAMQVAEAAHKYGRGLGARVLPIYGGQPIGRQLRELQRGVDLVVATPGRALDHLRRGTLPMSGIRCIVLDEADEMLDMGFAEDIDTILAEAPADRQTVLFSATMPPRIQGIARRHLRDAVRITIAAAKVDDAGAALVRQTAYIVRRPHKVAALGRILDVEAPEAAIVFCRTRTEVDELTETLSARGYRAEALHGGMSQEQRDRVMGRLRSGTAELLIATDVAARGLDVEHLTHVVNFDVPSAPEAYVHRIGRVGRAGRSGVAITLAEPREHRLLKQIERVAGRRLEIAKVPTVADLRTRRLELTRAAIRETLLEDDFEEFRVVVETLADEFDVMDVALAAVKLASAAAGEVTDEEEIPDANTPRHEDRPDRARHSGGRDAGAGRQAAGRGARDGEGGGRQAGGRQRRGGAGAARIFFGAGREAGIRPQDLVGAIANEAGIPGREIGAIEISERHSIVEVGEDVAQDVITAMRGTTLKGRKVTVRRDSR